MANVMTSATTLLHPQVSSIMIVLAKQHVILSKECAPRSLEKLEIEYQKLISSFASPEEYCH